MPGQENVYLTRHLPTQPTLQSMDHISGDRQVLHRHPVEPPDRRSPPLGGLTQGDGRLTIHLTRNGETRPELQTAHHR
jgi:hypothetical protein